MRLFEETLTTKTAAATPMGARHINEATAICKYYADSMCVYQSNDGSYYYHALPHEQMEFFPFGQVELLSELELLDDQYHAEMVILHDDNAALNNACGMSVVMAIVPTDNDASFVVYHEGQQTYYLISSRSDLDRLTPAVRMELEKITPAVNTLATPHKVLLDDFGDVARLEAMEL